MQRPDPMIPSKPGAEDQEAMQNRPAWIADLYKSERSHDKDHPMHGLYTGLAKKHYNTRSVNG